MSAGDGGAVPGFDAPLTRREQVPDPPATRREQPVEPGGLLRLPDSLRLRWRIVGELAGGGEADVVLVQDAAGDQRVVKIYRRGVAVDAQAALRLTTLDRTYLAAPFETGSEHGRHWELMEYVSGGTLAGLPRLSPPDVLEVLRQLTEALGELHRARITHSDLKPANVLVRATSPLSLALSDFGLSKYLAGASKRFTRTGNTVAYAAPESFAGRFSPAQDWWALGMIVRELTTGEPAFAGLADAVIMHELMVHAVPLDGIADDRLRLLCRGLLVRDPDHRWSGTQVRQWLSGGSPAVHDVGDVRAGTALKVAGRLCWTRTEAARAFATEWDTARDTFLRHIHTRGGTGEGWRLLRAWLEQFDEDVEQRARLIDQVLTADVPADVRMVHLLRWLDPSLPPTYRALSVLPADLAGTAAPGQIVEELWDPRHKLLEVLAQFAGGAELADADRRWRNSMVQLEAIGGLPGPAGAALANALPLHRSALLRAALDPASAATLTDEATRTRNAFAVRPPWFEALHRVRDPAVALAIVTVAPLVAAEQARLTAERNRGRLQWEADEAERAAGATKAVGFASIAAGIWAVVLVTGAFAAMTGGGLFGLGGTRTDPVTGETVGADPTAVVAFVFVFTWLANAVSEVALANHIGTPYHPSWSALTGLTRISRRLPDVWDRLRRAGNAARGAAQAAPVVAGVVCCVGCCFSGFILGSVAAVYSLATLGASAAHLGWVGLRFFRFNRVREQHRRTLLGDTSGGHA